MTHDDPCDNYDGAFDLRPIRILYLPSQPVKGPVKGRVELTVRIPPDVTVDMPPDFYVVLDGQSSPFPPPDEFRINDKGDMVSFVWTFVRTLDDVDSMFVVLRAFGGVP